MGSNIHLIGIGERIMCDLAVVLQQQGCTITGSAEVLSEPIQTRLTQVGLLPEQLGWFPSKVTKALARVIVGRQVQADNVELQVAQQLGLDIKAYPTYLYEYAQDKQRIVITGGPTSIVICAIAVQVLRYWHRAFDYVVDVPGLASSVQLSEAPIILLQGDALPCASIDPQPQFLAYQHHVVLISGLSEERDGAYTTLDGYIRQLYALADASPKAGTLIYDQGNKLLQEIGAKPREDVKSIAYSMHPHRYRGGQAYLITDQGDVPILHTDELSLRAIAGAQQLLQNVGITSKQFYEAIPTCSMTRLLAV